MRHVEIHRIKPLQITPVVSRMNDGLDFYLILDYIYPFPSLSAAHPDYYPHHKRIWERIGGNDAYGGTSLVEGEQR